MCPPPRDLVREFLAYGLRVARVGVALRMYLFFLEPSTVRVPALLDPRFKAVIVLPRKIAGSRNMYTDAWFVWLKDPFAPGPYIYFAG